MGTERSKPFNIRSREVQDAVGRAQHRRQVLIFGIQALFALNVALVYRATTHATWLELMHGSAAALFACYVMFSVWCLSRSAGQRLRWFDVVLSITLDYALYMVVVLQRSGAGIEDGGGLNAAPLFSFVYLFIAMRCLHYRAVYVYLAGGLASVGWLLYILTAHPEHAEHMFAALQSLKFNDAVLAGAVDKLISIVAVTGVLAVCVKEARKHLYASTIRGVAGKGLTRMVGEDVANEVLFSQKALVPGRGRHQMVAILMMDIRDFTKIAHKADPSDVIALLAKYQQLVEPVIVRYGGVIDKFMGDGILAHFGAMDADPSYAAHALKCIEHLLHKTDRWNAKRREAGYVPLQFRLSCAVGEAVVGLVGGTTKVEFTIIGDPVNLAAKLEKHAKKLEARAVTTAAAYKLARLQGFKAAYPVRKVIGETVGGLDKPMDLVVLGDRQATVARNQNQATKTGTGPDMTRGESVADETRTGPKKKAQGAA